VVDAGLTGGLGLGDVLPGLQKNGLPNMGVRVGVQLKTVKASPAALQVRLVLPEAALQDPEDFGTREGRGPPSGSIAHHRKGLGRRNLLPFFPEVICSCAGIIRNLLRLR